MPDVSVATAVNVTAPSLSSVVSRLQVKGALVSALQRFSLTSRKMTEIAAFNAWHIAPTRDGRVVVTDTVNPDIGLQIVGVRSGLKRTLCHPGSSSQGSQWRTSRYAEAQDWAAAEQLSWMELGGDTVYGPQWSHPHPSWSPDERHVVFTSDRTGNPQVYVAEVPEALLRAVGA